MNDEHAGRVGSAMGEYQGPLIRYAARITLDVERAADAVQETFLRLWSAREPPGLDHLAQWLFRVCRNVALDIRRKEHRMSALDETHVQARPSSDPGPAASAEKREALAHALRALSTLPDNQQEVVRLKFQNDFSYRQIAGITGLSVSNVGFLIHTAIKKIRQQLGLAGSSVAQPEGAAQ